MKKTTRRFWPERPEMNFHKLFPVLSGF